MLSRFNLAALGLIAVFVLALLGDHRLEAASKGERRIAIYNIHTQETLDIVYMRDGKRIPEAMKRLNWIMRDYRENQTTKMDPKLIDLLWEIHTELGSRKPIYLISGYRSPKTNAMLRRTRGGQAKRSRHMLGKAADIHFPDVPIRRLRYAGLTLERGGVGYYPTSAIPFVHIDTGRVRHWPRMPRYELALLFPNGHTLHRPKRGGPITKRDVKIARLKYPDMAQRVAAFFDSRGQPAVPRPVQIAAATREQFRTEVIFAQPSGSHDLKQPVQTASQDIKLAALGPVALPAPKLLLQPTPAALTQDQAILRASPRLAERPSTLKPRQPSQTDRKRLTQLFTLASLLPAAQKLFATVTGTTDKPSLPDKPEPAIKKSIHTSLKTSKGNGELTIASLIARDQARDPQSGSREAQVTSQYQADEEPVDRFDWASGWVTAPAYDDEHPEELSYRPFPLAPLLTLTSSPHDPALSQMVHPDVAGTLDFIDDTLSALPLKFRPGSRRAALMWTDQFSPQSNGMTDLNTREAEGIPERPASSTGVASRNVQTSTF